MKALPISVYSNRLYRGCSNGGITERFDELLLICPDGFIEVDENDPPENLVMVGGNHGAVSVHDRQESQAQYDSYD